MAGAVVPVVFYQDPMAALRWLEQAFGFETTVLVTDQQGQLAHAEMAFEGAAIGVGGEWSSPELLGPAALKSPASLGGVGTQFVRIFLGGDIDAHCARAEAAGARISQRPEDQFYGERTYRALDLEGHVWNFGQSIGEVSVAEMEQATGLTIKAPGR